MRELAQFPGVRTWSFGRGTVRPATGHYCQWIIVKSGEQLTSCLDVGVAEGAKVRYFIWLCEPKGRGGQEVRRRNRKGL